jgi:phosphoribosylpyrophosphate synthetase
VHELTGIHSLKEYLNEIFFHDPLSLPISIAFPDEGAYKRFRQYFEGYDLIICEKRRQGKKRIITIKEGEPKGKRICMVDDLILSGATLLGCAEVLKNEGAVSVGAYATHAVFPSKNWQDFREAGVSLYLTDSCPVTIAEIRNDPAMQPEDMEVISLAPAIAKEIFRNGN